MPDDAFEQQLWVHLNNLYHTLAAEHRVAIEHLEGRIASCKTEDESHQKQSTQHEDHPGNSLPVLNDAGDHSLGDGHLPVMLPFRMPNQSENLDSRSLTRATEPCSDTGASLKGPTIADDVPIPEDHSRHHDVERSPSGESASTNFKILDIWSKPRLRLNSQKVSTHSLDKKSTTSASFLSITGPNSEEESDGDDSATQWWIESTLQRLVISPSSWKHLSWEILGLVFVAYDIVTIPLQVFEPPETIFTILLSWWVRFCWTFDVLVSFLTGYVSPQGLVEMRPVKVARRYIHTRFFFDLALVSCDWAEASLAALESGHSSQDAAVLRRLLSMLRTIRLVRLLRLIKSQKLSEFIFEHIRSEGVKLVAYIHLVLVSLLCLIHVIACMWHGLCHASGISWQGGPGDHFTVQYFSAFHYVLSLFAGEQLREPENLSERLFVITVSVFALVVSAAFVGSLTTAMIQLQIIASKRSTQFAALNRYLSDYGISRELASRVQRNARHALTEQKRHTPESSVELMALISDPLRSEIHYEVHAPVLTAHPFFCLYNKVNHVGMRHICHTAVCPVSLSRGDVIFSEFELPVSPRMFFIVSGQLLYVRGAEVQQNVTAKQWVAEGVLWTRWVHQGTLRALTESRLLSIDAQRVANIMSTFPTLHGFNYAMKFVESLNQAACSSELTDISEGEEEARQMAACVFRELDRVIEVPWESRSRRLSAFSVGSFVSRRRISCSSSHHSGASVFPDGTSE